MRESTVAELTTAFTANHRGKQIGVINSGISTYCEHLHGFAAACLRRAD